MAQSDFEVLMEVARPNLFDEEVREMYLNEIQRCAASASGPSPARALRLIQRYATALLAILPQCPDCSAPLEESAGLRLCDACGYAECG